MRLQQQQQQQQPHHHLAVFKLKLLNGKEFSQDNIFHDSLSNEDIFKRISMSFCMTSCDGDTHRVVFDQEKMQNLTVSLIAFYL